MRGVTNINLSIGLVVAAMLSGPGSDASADELKMGGTGSAATLLERLGGICTRGSGTRIVVVPNLGSGGGIRAASDRALDVAVAGRPLKPEEAAKGLTQVASVRTPFVLITSHARPNGLKGADVADIYGSAKAVWDDGTPLRIVLRPKSDSDTAVLEQHFPGMRAALDKASRRREVATAATDQDNANLAESLPGSLTGASYTQVKIENRNVRLVALDGVEPTLENFERGVYRYGRTLHFIVPVPPSPTAERFIACVRSAVGVQALRDAGNLLNAD